MPRWARRLATAAVVVVALAAVLVLAGPRVLRSVNLGIPELPTFSAPRRFIGAPATPRPIASPPVPRHPFMAANGRSGVHDDAYMSDSYRAAGPLGRDVKVTSTFFAGLCGSVTFDRRGRIVTLCLSARDRFLVLLDPRSLDRLATFSLPGRSLGGSRLTDFSGGGYFFLDDRDRAVVPTTGRHVYVIAQASGPRFRLVRDVDLTRVVPEEDSISSALPDWGGRLWFVTTRGVVGVIPRGGGAPRVLRLREGIQNSFAVDETGGVFVVSNRALYRFDVAAGERPRVSWREAYPNSGVRKPGQADDGSGTTPTLLGRRWVAIADNARRLGVVVYRRGRAHRGDRLVCRQTVFGARAATENSLIAAGRSLIVENNYGYSGPGATLRRRSTEPGMARVDLEPDGRGCRVAWTSAVRAPSVVAKVSLANGLVYTYTKPAGPGSAPWYLTALDFRTGRVAYSVLAGRGIGYNNHYAPVTLGPDGSAYVGSLGGLVRLADGRTRP